MKIKRLFSKLRYKSQLKNSEQLEFKVLSSDGNYETLKLFLPKKNRTAKKITKGIDINDFDYFWELRDDLFKSIIIKSFEPQIISFFKKAHTDQFIYKNNSEKESLKVIDMYYHFYSDEIYLFIEPSYDYYSDGKIKRLELHLKYDSEEFEKLLIQILDLWQIDYSSFKEEDSYESIWDSELEISEFFLEQLFLQWSNIKKQTKSKLIGFISYATGGLYTYDLDNQKEVKNLKNETKKYLESRNIYIKSELS